MLSTLFFANGPGKMLYKVNGGGGQFMQAKEDVASLRVCILESDGYQPTGYSGPCRLKKGNFKKGEPSMA